MDPQNTLYTFLQTLDSLPLSINDYYGSIIKKIDQFPRTILDRNSAKK